MIRAMETRTVTIAAQLAATRITTPFFPFVKNTAFTLTAEISSSKWKLPGPVLAYAQLRSTHSHCYSSPSFWQWWPGEEIPLIDTPATTHAYDWTDICSPGWARKYAFNIGLIPDMNAISYRPTRQQVSADGQSYAESWTH